MNRRTAIAAISAFACKPAFALYDSKPDDALASVQGEWTGQLTYRDYRQPDRLVTLPTRLFVALSAPGELVLHYVFDDGPGKTVYSYEKMDFRFGERQIVWESGSKDRSTSVLQIKADTVDGDLRSLVFEASAEGRIDRYRMDLSARALRLAKDEVKPDRTAQFRNRFEFGRVASSGR